MDKEKLKNIPKLPGVYIMKGGDGQILYIGKSASLRQRVQSYFRRDSGLSPRIALMAEKVKDISFIVTGSEAEALITESAFIKRFKPRYNVALKDDKSYPYLKFSLAEDFPTLEITRRLKDDGSSYYGPYTDVLLLRKALRIIKGIFPLRSCRSMPKKACLDYQLGLCYAPCIGAIGRDEYMEVANQIKLFLEGQREKLVDELSKKMKSASEKKDFEKALIYRDRIISISGVPKKLPGRYRKGIVTSQGRERKKRFKPYDEINTLRYFLNMRRIPKRIEAFDISNISGREAVGSLITFIDGRPSKANYRKFRIRRVDRINDCKMMKEVLERRYASVRDKKLECPDLIIVDGGKGQLNAARSALNSLGFERIPVIGIAKRFEHIFVVGRSEPIIFSENSPILHLIQRLRNEAHRFAISYHHLLKRKKLKKSALDDIIGIGDTRKKVLLTGLGSVEGIKKASVDEISSIKGIDRKTALRIKEYLRSQTHGKS